MVTSFGIANATIKIGASYDSTKFILGDAVSDRIQLIPKLTQPEITHLAKASNVSVGYKVYNTTKKLMLQWDSSDWIPVNDTVAGHLAANTAAGQTIIKICDTSSPTPGQVLTATSATTAIWADSTGGGQALTNASYTSLIGNGTDTSITVSHNLNTDAVLYGVWETSGTKSLVDCTVSIVSANALTFHFTTPPAAGSLKVVIVSAVFSNAQVVPPGVPDQTNQTGKFLKTDGFNAYWEVPPTGIPLVTGQSGKFLGNDGNTASWQTINIPDALPSQTGQSGKFLGTNGATPLWQDVYPSKTGNSGKYLTTDGSIVAWQTIPTWMANPMAVSGDLIVGGVDGAAGRLGIGSPGQSLVAVDGVTVGWRTLLPDSTGNNGKFLTTNGTANSWVTISQVPAMSGTTNTKILSNDGTNAVWITNSNPPSASGQNGKFLSSDGTNFSWSSISQVPATTGHSGKILTNDGASVYWNPTSMVYPTQSGHTGQFLTTNGSSVSWADPPSGFANPMTTYADLIVGYTNGDAVRLGPGADGQVLSVTSAYDPVPNATVKKLQWISLTSYLTNPMTTQGDTIYGGASGAPTRLGIGGNGALLVSNGSNPTWLSVGSNQQVLTSNGSTPYWLSMTIVPSVSGHAGQWLYTDGSSAYWSNFTQIPSQSTHNGQFLTTDGTNLSWQTIPAGFANPMTQLGDLIAGQASGVAGRLAIGSNNQVLTVVSGSPTWANPPTGVPTQTGNNGKFLTTNGTTASWAQIYQVPSVTGNSGLFLGNDGINYTWQTVPGTIPTMTGQAGKYLTNDGSSAYWTPYNGLPSLSGNSGKILTTDGVTSFWVTPSAAGSNILSRIQIQVTSSVLAILAQEIKTVDTTCKTFQLQSISSDTPCRVRIYGTYAAATADLLRSASLDPTGNHGMYTEVVLTQANPSWIMSPVPTCVNEDTVPSTNFYITITNNGSSTKAVVLTLDLLKME